MYIDPGAIPGSWPLIAYIIIWVIYQSFIMVPKFFENATTMVRGIFPAEYQLY